MDRKKVSLCLVVIFVFSLMTPLQNVRAETLLKVHYIDVGQGDAIFIDYGDFDILIDGGNREDGTKVVNYLKSLETDDIEILVATHPHEDHIGGINDVLNSFNVEKVIDSGLKTTSVIYERYMEAVNNEVGVEFLEDADMSFDLGNGAIFKVLETGDAYSDADERSVVTLLDYNNVEFLFTGDLGTTGESDILNQGIEAEILKVGNHGSKTSSSDAFLQKVTPEVAIISAGEGNLYGYPHQETLNRIQKYTNKIFGTWLSGTIIVSTNGDTYSLNTDNGLNNSTSQGFTDIQTHWAKSDIEFVASKGIVTGKTSARFVPDEEVTRGEFATLLVRALGISTYTGLTSQFTDVIKSDWYFGNVEGASRAGILYGYGNGRFGADDNITREQMSVAIVRAMALKGIIADITITATEQLLQRFADRDNIQNWATEGVAKGVHFGIINGVTSNTFAPGRNVSRAEAVIMIKRMMEKTDLL